MHQVILCIFWYQNNQSPLWANSSLQALWSRTAESIKTTHKIKILLSAPKTPPVYKSWPVKFVLNKLNETFIPLTNTIISTHYSWQRAETKRQTSLMTSLSSIKRGFCSPHISTNIPTCTYWNDIHNSRESLKFTI